MSAAVKRLNVGDSNSHSSIVSIESTTSSNASIMLKRREEMPIVQFPSDPEDKFTDDDQLIINFIMNRYNRVHRVREKNEAVSQITANIFIGDLRSCTPEYIQKYGIKYTICAMDSYAGYQHCPCSEDAAVINVADVPEANLYSEFPYICRLIHTRVSNGENILVHCVSGRSRSVTIVMAYLISEGLSYRKAYSIISKKRHIGINKGFIQQLKHWEYDIIKRGISECGTPASTASSAR